MIVAHRVDRASRRSIGPLATILGASMWLLASLPGALRADPLIGRETKLRAMNPANDSLLGGSVDIAGDTIVLGEHAATHSGIDLAGAAYVFVRNGANWTRQATL